MILRLIASAGLLAILGAPVGALAADPVPDAQQDILVTFVDTVRASGRGGIGAPYRNRKRYAISADAKRDAAAIAEEYMLVEVDSWPIKSLSVYCVVYRLDQASERAAIIDRLGEDPRVESVQLLNEFDTNSDGRSDYDDPHAPLQHGLKTLAVESVHRRSTGRGVRIVVIDSAADESHEDLRGRLGRVEDYTDAEQARDSRHGTAIVSVIGARSNNAIGMVGVAPRARIDLFTACWGESESDRAVCDTFTLAKALDAVADDPPDLVNLSLTGPNDRLLERILRRLYNDGVVLVAATADSPERNFPASVDVVIGVSSSSAGPARASTSQGEAETAYGIHAPGDQILVAIPENEYDFRSGSSIAAAHVTGVIALLLARQPDLPRESVRGVLMRSQALNLSGETSINACIALELVDSGYDCG